MMFFFSSRRRNTRWPRDWSSDVCSSDLYISPSSGESSPFMCFRHVVFPAPLGPTNVEIGRASCRERVKVVEGEGRAQHNNVRPEARGQGDDARKGTSRQERSTTDSLQEA